MKSVPENLFQRVRGSIFPDYFYTQTDHRRKRFFLNNLFLHFRPTTVPESTIKFTLTWGLGGMAAVLVVLQFCTGILLKFAYDPAPAHAYASIVFLQNEVLFGKLIRNIHHWCGNLLLLVVLLHLLRIFFSGAIHPPRQFNWIIGLTMFLLVLGSNFTGYLLPWDQLAFWAVTICTGMLEYLPGIGGWLQMLIRGGSDIGAATLSNFFTIHTAVIPACLLILMPFHFWRVRKAGGLVIPRTPDQEQAIQDEKVPAIPNLILRELAVAAALIAFVMVLSVTFNAPMGAKANPGLSPNPTKAPWYFAGLQELLLHFHPLFAVMIIPSIMLGALLFLPYIRYDTDTAGVWFVSHRGRKLVIAAAVTAAIITPLGIIADEFLVDFAAWLPVALPAVVSNGLLPAAFVLAGVIGFYGILKKKYTATNNETVQSVFVLLLTAFIILTITCIWFRGTGMALMWPWQVGVVAP